jgi:hypothetical protein
MRMNLGGYALVSKETYIRGKRGLKLLGVPIY